MNQGSQTGHSVGGKDGFLVLPISLPATSVSPQESSPCALSLHHQHCTQEKLWKSQRCLVPQGSIYFLRNGH